MKCKVYFLLLLALFGCACRDYRRANDVAVEKLRQALLRESFEEIYRETSSINRATVSLEDFTQSMKPLTEELKAVDPEIKWSRDTTILYDQALFHDENFSSLHLEGRGKKINVNIEWEDNFKMCALSTFSDPNDSGKRIFRNCD